MTSFEALLSFWGVSTLVSNVEWIGYRLTWAWWLRWSLTSSSWLPIDRLRLDLICDITGDNMLMFWGSILRWRWSNRERGARFGRKKCERATHFWWFFRLIASLAEKTNQISNDEEAMERKQTNSICNLYKVERSYYTRTIEMQELLFDGIDFRLLAFERTKRAIDQRWTSSPSLPSSIFFWNLTISPAIPENQNLD